ncbi:mCG147697 [Mus musculus]|nr:mCG147697 [Mus musculus]
MCIQVTSKSFMSRIPNLQREDRSGWFTPYIPSLTIITQLWAQPHLEDVLLLFSFKKLNCILNFFFFFRKDLLTPREVWFSVELRMTVNFWSSWEGYWDCKQCRQVGLRGTGD